jgi:hypothetical protein
MFAGQLVGVAMRLIGLWSEPGDVDAFEREYLGSHFPKLERLRNGERAVTSRCIDGTYFRMTEVTFRSLDDIHAALDDATGQQILTDAQALAAKFGVRLDVIVVSTPT